MWRREKRRKNNKYAQEIRKRIKCAFFFENKIKSIDMLAIK